GNPAANTGVGLTGVQFTDALTAGLTVASSPGMSNSCGGTVTAVANSNSIALMGGSLPTPGQTCTITVNVTGTTAGTKPNRVTVSSANGGPNATAGTASLIVLAPPTISEAFGAASIPLNSPGNVTQLTFTITNPNGTTSLTGLALTDTF